MTAAVSVQSMKIRLPEFADADDAALQFAIDEASRQVDASWVAGDRALAIMYLAAHFSSVSTTSADSGGRETTSESIGPISESYAVPSGSSGRSVAYEKTTYGQRFVDMRRRNHAGPMVV